MSFTRSLPLLPALFLFVVILFTGPAFSAGPVWAQAQRNDSTKSAGTSSQTGRSTGRGRSRHGTSKRGSTKHRSTKRGSSKHNSKSRRSRERAQHAPTPERISEVQAALAAQGHYSGQPTGKWDASTVEATKHYQQENGLPATGKLDARTLQKLGLGSQVAGVGAPHPPAPAATPPR
ncbi:MAG: peptidoglycan-binding protein [Acidipila sp.]|nr:peptidoglycan-binding protein [Acidipila sp.]